MSLNIKNEVLIRVYIVLFGVVLFGVVLFTRTLDISYYEGQKWRDMGRELYVKYVPVSAERGNIVTEDGSLLATSLPFFEIGFDPSSSGMLESSWKENIDSLSLCLAQYVAPPFEFDTLLTDGGWKNYLQSKRDAGAEYVPILREASYRETEKLRNFPLFRLGQFKGGFIAKPKFKRERPFGLLAQRTIGYVREGFNPVGLEGYYNDVLGGEKVKIKMKRVGKDVWKPIDDLTSIAMANGDDIVTTIDINIQDKVEKALYRAVKNHWADRGTAVVMEVATGKIKAIANLGKFKEGYGEIYNYAVGESVEPGSTFKLATMMALLEDGYVNLNDSIDLEKGTYDFYEEQMLDASYHNLDTTTILDAFAISSNVGMGKLVDKYYRGQEEEWISRLKSMNLHLPTGIEIKGEGAPYIKEAYNEEQEWSGITLPWMSIGYELMMTPLQLLTFYNSVANDGRMMKPYLATAVQRDGVTLKKIKPTVISKRIASRETIEKAQLLLKAVVEKGTAKKWQSRRYSFAGKTGTAQMNYRKFRQNRLNIKHRASFVGYFPADNPVYSCIVVISDPKVGGIYGSEVALPVFREIADRCYDAKNEMHPALNAKPRPIQVAKRLPLTMTAGKREDLSEILPQVNLKTIEEDQSEWVRLSGQSDTLNLRKRYVDEKLVPDVRGMGLRDAVYLLENLGLHVVFTGAGKVVNQSIKYGTRIRGQTIRLTLG